MRDVFCCLFLELYYSTYHTYTHTGDVMRKVLPLPQLLNDVSAVASYMYVKAYFHCT